MHIPSTSALRRRSFVAAGLGALQLRFGDIQCSLADEALGLQITVAQHIGLGHTQLLKPMLR